LELPVNIVLSGSPFTVERVRRLVKSKNFLEVSLGSTGCIDWFAYPFASI